MIRRIVGDVSGLPDKAYGSRTLIWWGVLGFILIEGTAFALACGGYLFLIGHTQPWPPHATPKLWAGTLFTALILLSEIPNIVVKRMAYAQRERATRLYLVIMCLIGFVLLGVRAFEFMNLNVRWDDNAYGSIVWALIFLHTTHLLTDLADTLVLTAFTYTHEVDTNRFSDVVDNAMYWRFVVLCWLPIYALIYWAPRFVS